MTGPEMKDNPAYEALEQLKRDVGLDDDDLRNELKTPTENFFKAWWGTQADTFSTDLEGRDSTLRTKADNLEGDVQEKMNSTPSEIPDD